MLNRKTRLYTIVLALTGLMSLAACDQPPPEEKPIRPVLSQVAEVKPDWRESTYAGQVQARNETSLSFRIGGKIIDRTIDVGDKVEAGAILAQIDPADYQLQLMEAEAGLSAARAEKSKADADLKRYKKLLEQKLVSKADYTNYSNKLNVTKARLRQAEAELEVMRNQAIYTSLKADHAGVVTAVEAEKGQVVTAGQTILKLALAGKKEVAIAVPENRLDELKDTGSQEIHITLWSNPGMTYSGKLRETSPGADPVTRTYSAKITLLDADADVQLGMTATVNVRQKVEGEVARLPLSSIYQQDTGEPAVWIVDSDSKVKLVPVEVSGYTQTEALIRSGVTSGQRVVTAGVHKLISGQKVRVTQSD